MQQHSSFRALWLIAVLLAAAVPARADPPRPGFAGQVAPLLDAAVAIRAVAETAHGSLSFEGSGFIIDPAGIIVTNRHVISGAYQIYATVRGLGELPAVALYVSDTIDLAILRVEPGRKLAAVKLGDSDAVRVGDEVLLLGNPLAVGESLSYGVISALNRDIGDGSFDHFFQTDAAINHGNSGGPMFNLRGEVVAINTALDSSPGNTGSIGIGFAMPINDAKFEITQFLRNGRIEAGTIGVKAQRLTQDVAAGMGIAGTHGLIVTEVDPRGPAPGLLLAGDVIVRVEGRAATDSRELGRLVATAPPGKPLAFVLVRQGTTMSVTVPVREVEHTPASGLALLGHAPAGAQMYATPANPGMTLEPLTDALRRHYALGTGVTGAVVTAVAPNSAAAHERVAVGDVIAAVGGVPVATPAAVRQALEAAVTQHRPFAALLVAGDRGPHWVALPLAAER